MLIERPGQKGLNYIAKSTAPYNVAVGSVRSGKTVCQIIRWANYAASAPPGPLAMIGKTERTLKRNILQPLQAFVGNRNFSFSLGSGDGLLYGRPVRICGANDERAEGKIRGDTFAGLLGDEVTLWPESFWIMAHSRLSIDGAKAFLTTNPDAPFHWFKKDFLDNEELYYTGDLKQWHFILDDNPHISDDYKQRLKRLYVGLWYRRFILGEWCLAEGAIYDLFDEELNSWDDDSGPGFKVYRRVVSVDYGTSNPMTFGLYLLPRDIAPQRIALEREYYYDSRDRRNAGRQKTDSQYADDLEKFIGSAEILGVIVDPSATSFIVELRNRGFRVILADNDVSNGIRLTARWMANRWYRVHRRCRKTFEEIAGYVWDENAAKRGEEKPKKIADHTCDRDRYAIQTLFGTPLQPRRIGVYGAATNV